MDDSLNTAKARIRAAFESGIRMTTAQGNRIGKTVADSHFKYKNPHLLSQMGVLIDKF